MPDEATKGPAAEPQDGPARELEGLEVEAILGWKGHKLDEMSGAAVGRVAGAFVDEDTGRPEWLLARMGRFGHYCLVPARDAVGANGRVWVPYSRDQIRRAPRVEPSKPLAGEREQALLDHYGVGSSEAGRGADLAERGPSAITLRPG